MHIAIPALCEWRHFNYQPPKKSCIIAHFMRNVFSFEKNNVLTTGEYNKIN
jgi:hypothetical protein